MPGRSIEDAQRIVAATQAAQERFDAYSRQVRAEITMALFQGNEARAAMLEGALKQAARDVNKMERMLQRVLLSNAVVDDVVGGLEGVAAEADALLEEMERLGRTLDRIAKGAEIITKALQTLARFVV